MKYKTAHDMAKGLRDLADLIETHGVCIPSEFGEYDPRVTFSVYCHNKEAMAAMAKVLAKTGMVTKDFESSYATIKKNFGPHVKVEGWSSRDKVCKAVVVGQKEEVVKAYVETDKTKMVDIIEWECDPILAD